MNRRSVLKSRRAWLTAGLAVMTAIILLVGAAAPAAAQSSITITGDKAIQDFPNGITFTMEAASSARITKVFLDYGTNAVTCVRASGRIPVDFEEGSEISAEWEWDFKDSGSLPAGAEVWWRWEIHTEDGSILQSEQQLMILEDGRFSWKTVGEEPLLLYHDTRTAWAETLQQTGSEALAKMKETFGIAPSRPVKIILYNDSDELSQAALYLPEWVGGLAHPEYSILYIGVGDGQTSWGTDVIYHEMAHLISGELTNNCLGVSMPTWLSEGFSVYMENGPTASERGNVLDALENGSLPPLRTLAAGFSSNSFEAGRSYAQSGMIVRYLVDTYGSGKIPAVFAAIQDGQLINDALLKVYGLNTDGLDAAWRSSLGYPALPTPTPTAEPDGDPTPIPTLPLFGPELPTPVPSATATALPPSPTPLPEEPSAEPTETSGGGASCLGGNAFIAGLMAMAFIPAYRLRRKQS